MISGTPVVATDRGSPREVVGGGGIVVNSKEEIPKAVEKAVKIPSTNCYGNAWRFSLSDMAKQYLKIYKKG